MLVKEQWGVENVPIWHYLMLITRTQSKLLWSLCEPRLMKTSLKLQSILVSDTNKHFKLILIDSWILVKILEPTCLPRLSNCKLEKTTVQLLFSFFIQFSTLEIGSVFSYAKLMISWLKWLQKNWGCPSSLMSNFQLKELNIKANPPCFQCARARARANDAINYAQ